MNEIKKNDKKNLKFKIISIVIICSFAIFSLIFGVIRWINYGFVDSDDLSYLLTICVGSMCLMSTFHLWGRLPNLEGRLKKLFFLTGITFLVVFMIFVYVLISISLRWNNMTQILNELLPDIEFKFWYVIDYVISTKSAFNFCLALIALTFYLFPIERYVKQKSLPWHSISICSCMVFIPFIFILRDVIYYELILSIILTIIAFIVSYSCIFLFYLYFSTGMKSPKGTPMRRAGILIAFGLFFITVLLILRVGLLVMMPSMMRGSTAAPLSLLDILQIPFGVMGILIFNYGFYLIRPT